jgi:TRAP-type C4-dicarboxylate transport system permease small subunit
VRRLGAIRRIANGVHFAGRVALYSSAIFLMVMLLVVVADVVTRFARVPFKGAYDLGEMLMVCITYTALAFTQYEKGHVRVDILLARLPRRVALGLDTITLTACAVVAFLITWAMTGRVWEVFSDPGPDPVSLLLGWPLSPLYLLMAVGAFLLGLEFLIDAVRSGAHAVRGGDPVVPLTGSP